MGADGKTYCGIISRRMETGSKALICVWHPSSPLKEYKFPRWSFSYPEWFKIGERVEFSLTRGIDEVQDEMNIRKVTDPDKLRRMPEVILTETVRDGPQFKVKVNVGFPPNGVDPFREELDSARLYGCRAIGWCKELKTVAIMDDGLLSFLPGKFYTGLATRISADRDWVAQKMGTLWVLCPDSKLVEVTNPKKLDHLRPRVPWNNLVATNSLTSFAASDNCASTSAAASFADKSRYPATSSSAFALFDASTSPPPSLSVHQSNDLFLPPVVDEWEDNVTTTAGAHQQKKQHTNGGTRTEMVGINNTNNNNNTDRIDRENVLIGHLVAHNLEWIGTRDASAALNLQKCIMNLCHDYKARVLNEHNNNTNSPNRLGQQQGIVSFSGSSDDHNFRNLFG